MGAVEGLFVLLHDRSILRIIIYLFCFAGLLGCGMFSRSTERETHTKMCCDSTRGLVASLSAPSVEAVEAKVSRSVFARMMSPFAIGH